MGLLSWFGLDRWVSRQDGEKKDQSDVEEPCARPKSARSTSRSGRGSSRRYSAPVGRGIEKTTKRSTSDGRRKEKQGTNGSCARPVPRESRGQKHAAIQRNLKRAHSSTPPIPGKVALSSVKALWKVRPLPIDEKVRVFISGRDDGCKEYCGGEFYQWMRESESGRTDPMEAGAYPLIIQDSELRQVLEIKYPSERALQNTYSDIAPNEGAALYRAGREEKSMSRIKVPGWKKLPAGDYPETILRHQNVSVVVRNPDGNSHVSVRSPSTSGGAPKKGSMMEQAYTRYMQPTPDELDQTIEYDLDDEDEHWLEAYNKTHISSVLKEEWMEHLIDRMEKEYTYELQKHPEKWIPHRETSQNETDNKTGLGQGDSGKVLGHHNTTSVSFILPSVSEVFPLKKCLRARGLHLDQKVVKDVYSYWKRKHEKAGRPLIQRLWYEPPWHKKAADTTTAGSDGDDVFSGYDVPTTLSRIRKRRINDLEVQSRFDILRRDLETVRTIADLIRRREKLKRQEMALLKSEWDLRLKDIRSGKSISSTRRHLKSRPPPVSSVMGKLQETDQVDTPRAGSHVVEDRAARLAARRSIRNEALNFEAAKSSRRQISKRKSTRSLELQKKKGASTREQVQPRSRTGQFVSFKGNKRRKSSV